MCKMLYLKQKMKGRKCKYNVGDRINGVLFIKEIPHFTPKRRIGIFECPLCGNHYETRVDIIACRKSAGCGCQGYGRHNNTSSNGYRSEAYKTFASMMRRCYGNDPSKKKSYKDKGVIVCERWHDFRNFLADMGERPHGKTLDRFPNQDGNYEPSNCRWATAKEQSRNLSNNLIAVYKGESKTLQEWCEILGLEYHRMRTRIFLEGVPVDMAFTEPKRSAKICSFIKANRESKIA